MIRGNAGSGGAWVRHARAGVLRLVASCALLVSLAPCFLPKTSWAQTQDDRPPVTITVVEELPAEHIDDGAVPLAAGPGGGKAIEAPQVALMAGVLMASASYALYGRRCDERLFALRQEVVAAQRALLSEEAGPWT